YGPNGAARLKSPNGRICDIVNNYLHLSFNFGPPLLAWLEWQVPGISQNALEADAPTVQLRGHGNAIAQAYNHAILPLCNDRDLRTQITWGIAAFSHNFTRQPDAMWLPETAGNDANLGALIEAGMRYVVLSPHQAEQVRPL